MKQEEKDKEDENDDIDEEDDEDDKDDKDKEDKKSIKEEELEDILFAKVLTMTIYTSLPNLVRLAKWELVSVYRVHTIVENKAC